MPQLSSKVMCPIPQRPFFKIGVFSLITIGLPLKWILMIGLCSGPITSQSDHPKKYIKEEKPEEKKFYLLMKVDGLMA